MYKVIAILFLLLHPGTDDLQTGIDYYNKRYAVVTGLQSDPTNINKAIAIFEKELQKNPNSEQAGFYYMQSLNYKGRFVPMTEAEKKGCYNKAITIGNQLVKLYPKSAQLRLALISSIGLLAEINGALKSVQDGVVQQLLLHAQTLVKIDSLYFYGSGWKTIAIINYKTPYIPVIMSWPDKVYAKTLLQKSLKYFPADLSNNYYYAEALLENGQKTEAKIYFQLVTKLPTRKELFLEDESLKVAAAKQLAKLK